MLLKNNNKALPINNVLEFNKNFSVLKTFITEVLKKEKIKIADKRKKTNLNSMLENTKIQN